MPQFVSPRRILTGAGCFEQLAAVAAPLGQDVMVVIGRGGAISNETLAGLERSLTAADIGVDVYRGVLPEPPCDQVDELRERLCNQGADLVVGIGGGSVLDVAKAAAILLYSDKPTAEHLATGKLPARSLPLIAVPTTAGTGSEATPTAVLTDTSKRLKRSFRDPDLMMPAAAVVDPQLMVSCPPRLTAAAGMDALTQAIESYCSVHATSITEALSEKAIVLIAKNLERAYRNGRSIEARSAVAEGSLLAGMALANARLGLVHGLAHPIGGTLGLSHGVICAVLLPHVLAFNRPAMADRYHRLGKMLDGDPVDVSHNLLNTFGLQDSLAGRGMGRDRLAMLAEQAMVSGSTKANPRKVGVEDALTVLERVLG